MTIRLLSRLQVDVSLNYTIIITSTGRIFAWGANDYGQLGDGTTTNSNEPISLSVQYPTPEYVENYVYGSEITPYEPTREGYIFSGWYVDTRKITKYSFTTMPEEDIILYGFWTRTY